MIEDILKKVESPFTDEMIQNLIKLFIECKCDTYLFYDTVNNYDRNVPMEPEIQKRINELQAKGTYGDYFPSKNKKTDFLYTYNNAWVTFSSDEDPFDEKKITRDRRMPLVYRAYLNIKGLEKMDFVEKYLSTCIEEKIPFRMKFSKIEARDDQIIIEANEDTFEKNIEIIENLSEGLEIGRVPRLIGIYKGNIGIAEEYFKRVYSPSTAKLGVVESTITKYLCDHFEEFSEKLSVDEKRVLHNIKADFQDEYVFEREMVEKFGKEYSIEKKSYFQKMTDMECANKHIDRSTSYSDGRALMKLSDVVNSLYEEKPEEMIDELTKSFRMIATEAWGFSKNLVFSNQTEEKYLDKKTISVEDIETLLIKSENLPELLNTNVAEELGKKDNKSRED